MQESSLLFFSVFLIAFIFDLEDSSNVELSCKKLPVGVRSFKVIMEGNYCFVDKSEFIKEVFEDMNVMIFIARPQQFGKTIALSMLDAFINLNYSSNTHLFDNLNIMKHAEFCDLHRNKHPVINAKFSILKGESFGDVEKLLKNLVGKLFENHNYLLEGELLTTAEKTTFTAIKDRKAPLNMTTYGFYHLSMFMQRKFKKNVVIILDGYDAPLHFAFLHGYHRQMTKLLRLLLQSTLNSNIYLLKAVLSGLTKLPPNFFSGLNVKVYTGMEENFAATFGFTESEVLSLMKASRKVANFADIKLWYGGYLFGNQKMFNPYSVMECLEYEGAIGEYWAEKAAPQLLQRIILDSKSNILPYLEDLLQDQTIIRPLSGTLDLDKIMNDDKYFWLYLIQTGCLTAKKLKETPSKFFEAEVRVPNEELKMMFTDFVRNWFTGSLIENDYIHFAKSILSGDMRTFKMYISDYLAQLFGYHDFPKTSNVTIFHSLILGCLIEIGRDYNIFSDKNPSCATSVAILPKQNNKRGVLIRFEEAKKEKDLKRTAEKALHRLKHKDSIISSCKSKVKSVLAIGMTFLGPKVETILDEVTL